MQSVTRKTVVCVDTRRAVMGVAGNRKLGDVAREGHEQFIRNLLKDKLGWPRREQAPEAIKAAAREMASTLVNRDLVNLAKRRAEQQRRAAELAAEQLENV